MSPDRRMTALVFAGHDPSGGAGVQADIETFSAFGMHAVTVLTMITAQNNSGFFYRQVQSAEMMQRQYAAIQQEHSFQALKTGVLANREQVMCIQSIRQKCDHIPLVVDPVLRSTSGEDFLDETGFCALQQELLPLTTLLTPNRYELIRLGGSEDIDKAAEKLLSIGCKNILLTSAHRRAGNLYHYWYHAKGKKTLQSIHRAGEYHGTGCTLAAAVTAALVCEQVLSIAIRRGLDFVATSVNNADWITADKYIPRRN